MTLNELKDFVKQKGFFIIVRRNVIKLPNYRDYVIYLYPDDCRNYVHAWDVCYGDHWANKEDKVFQKIIEYIDNYNKRYDRL